MKRKFILLVLLFVTSNALQELYQQTIGASPNALALDQYYNDGSDNPETYEAADDFEVLANQTWTIQQLWINGFSELKPDGGYVYAWSVSIYNSIQINGSKQEQPGQQIYVLDTVNAQYQIDGSPEVIGYVVLSPNPAPVLNPGRYWLSVFGKVTKGNDPVWFQNVLNTTNPALNRTYIGNPWCFRTTNTQSIYDGLWLPINSNVLREMLPEFYLQYDLSFWLFGETTKYPLNVTTGITAVEIAKSSDSEYKPGFIAVIVILGVLVIAFAVAIALFFWFTRRITKHEVGEIELDAVEVKVVESLEIPILEHVQPQHLLGSGKFSQVYFGIWNEFTPVAMKKLRNEDDIKEFEQEANLLLKLQHPNVVQFLGKHVDDQGGVYMVLEYLSHGSLHYLLNSSHGKIPAVQLVEMCIGACQGMVFLAQKGVVHRDLSCRNLLVGKVGDKYLVKISDFGLSRAVVDFYSASENSLIPTRWASPESLKQGLFTVKSDIWAFGVTVWEIMKYATTPYNWLSNRDVAESVPKGEIQLPRPDNASDKLWNLMCACWELEPKSRPSFEQLLRELIVILKEYNATNQLVVKEKQMISDYDNGYAVKALLGTAETNRTDSSHYNTDKKNHSDDSSCSDYNTTPVGVERGKSQEAVPEKLGKSQESLSSSNYNNTLSVKSDKKEKKKKDKKKKKIEDSDSSDNYNTGPTKKDKRKKKKKKTSESDSDSSSSRSSD